MEKIEKIGKKPRQAAFRKITSAPNRIDNLSLLKGVNNVQAKGLFRLCARYVAISFSFLERCRRRAAVPVSELPPAWLLPEWRLAECLSGTGMFWFAYGRPIWLPPVLQVLRLCLLQEQRVDAGRNFGNCVFVLRLSLRILLWVRSSPNSHLYGYSFW